VQRTTFETLVPQLLLEAGMATTFLSELRGRLLATEAQLREEVRAQRMRLVEPAVATATTVLADEEREVMLLRQAQHRLEEVRAALRRLDDSSYGTCERCGGPIGMPRLQAAPESRSCLACELLAHGRGE
jgi:RNA polymerase-binding transcription factor DksA